MVTRCAFVKLDDGRWRCERCGKVVASSTGSIWATCAATNSSARICGVGCHLSRLLSWFGIRDDGKCGCAQHAAQMDALGPDGCEREIETIMGWLRDAAAKRLPLVPWVDAPARLLVHQAIAAARRDAHGEEAQAQGREAG